MKKIGILTFSYAENYGAILQAYGLMKYIESLNKENDVHIINFKTEEQKRTYSIFNLHKMSFVVRFVMTILILMRYPSFYRRKRRFAIFINSFLNLTKHYRNEDELLKSPPKMDVYISGSDQVFNPNRENYKVYYLGFDKQNAKKIAYAPSFGIRDFNKEVGDKVSHLLKDFDNLSCRESDGSEFISRVVAYDVPVVIDPVFLLSKEQWLNIAISSGIKGKYICVYDLNGGLKLIELAQKISRETGYPIYCITKNVTKNYSIKKKIYDAGPQEFVGLIADAEFVVTDSFHGTSFAILLGKKFISYNALPRASSRITSLLENMNLTENYVDNKCDLTINADSIKSVDIKILNNFTLFSKEYLIKSI